MAYVTLKPDFTFDPSEEAALLKELVLQVRKTIGPFASPKRLVLVPDLPKTRSGKVSTFCSSASVLESVVHQKGTTQTHRARRD